MLLSTIQGHLNAVINISFAHEQCLTASASQAIIFNLNSLEKLHELSINTDVKIKQMFFMPVTNHILACFVDDYIHVWKNGSFDSFKKLMPSEWNKFSIKSIAITRNGTTMVVAGISSKLIVFSLDTWILTRILNLSEEIRVKSIDFVSQAHDGGANKYIIFLTTNGVINLLDMEQSVVVARIQHPSEIISFTCSTNGTHLSCILRSGEINIHKMSLFMETSSMPTENTVFEPAEVVSKSSKLKLFLPPRKRCEDLNLGKLQNILKEYGEYPENYRTLIWTKILMLPYNINNYSAVSGKGLNSIVSNIDEKYPLENKIAMKNFKRLLSNLANWSPTLFSMDFLPLFVFPFVKIFENDPVICFEAAISIIINWCQHWFEYAPVPPVNVLGMIENVFRDHDPELLALLTEKKVTSHLYAWSLLEVGFSEVLTIKEWCIFWDHILSNEPSFLLMAPIAYNIVNRSVLAQMDTLDKFEAFYHNQNPLAFKRFVSKMYFLKKFTRKSIHPRQYLHDFKPLIKGCYPLFENGPKADVIIGDRDDHFEDPGTSNLYKASNFHDPKINTLLTDKNTKNPPLKSILSNKGNTLKNNTAYCLRTESAKTATIENANARLRGGVHRTHKNANDLANTIEYLTSSDRQSPYDENDIKSIENEILKVQRQICNLQMNDDKETDLVTLKREEANRIKMLENVLQEKLLQEKVLADKRKLELSRMRTKLFDMQAESMEKTHRTLECIGLEERKRELDLIMHQIESLQKADELEIQRTEEELSRHYVDLLKQKTALENILLQSVEDDELLNTNYEVIEEQRKSINEELLRMRKSIGVARVNAKLNMSCRMTVENDKLNKVDVALAREMAHKQRQVSLCNSNIQLLKMEQDTKALENEVEQLLQQFSSEKRQNYVYKIHKIRESLSGRRKLINEELELTCLRKLNISECNECDRCGTKLNHL